MGLSPIHEGGSWWPHYLLQAPLLNTITLAPPNFRGDTLKPQYLLSQVCAECYSSCFPEDPTSPSALGLASATQPHSHLLVVQAPLQVMGFTQGTTVAAMSTPILLTPFTVCGKQEVLNKCLVNEHNLVSQLPSDNEPQECVQ